MESIPNYDSWKTTPPDDEEEVQQERRFNVRSRYHKNYCDYMEEQEE